MDEAPNTASEIVRLQRRVDVMLLRRATFPLIEDMIDGVTTLTLDQKAALWLYAWAHQPAATQRSQARVTLALVTPGT